MWTTLPAALVAGYEIVPKEPIAQKALPECNITFISGADMKAKVSGYLKVLYDQNPSGNRGAARCPTTHSIMARNKRKNRIANTLAVCFWLCAWQAASVCIGQKLILVSPLEVCGALLALLPTADFWQTAAFSAGRIIGGFLLALAPGLALAALAAALRWVEVLLRPLMLTIKSIPVASFIILALMLAAQRGQSGGVHQLFDGAARGVYEHAGGHP